MIKELFHCLLFPQEIKAHEETDCMKLFSVFKSLKNISVSNSLYIDKMKLNTFLTKNNYKRDIHVFVSVKDRLNDSIWDFPTLISFTACFLDDFENLST